MPPPNIITRDRSEIFNTVKGGYCGWFWVSFHRTVPSSQCLIKYVCPPLAFGQIWKLSSKTGKIQYTYYFSPTFDQICMPPKFWPNQDDPPPPPWKSTTSPNGCRAIPFTLSGYPINDNRLTKQKCANSRCVISGINRLFDV